MKREKLASIRVMDSQAELVLPTSRPQDLTTIRLTKLPDSFIQWQLESRRTLFHSHMLSSGQVARFQAHLPVLVTRSANGAFPFHTANKGVGLLPTAEDLGYYIDQFKRLLKERSSKPWRETLKERITLMDSLYSAPERLDLGYMGSLEIFQGQSFQNILGDPRVSLQFTGGGPNYPSFQINAVAEVVYPGDLRFEFLYWARQLFEYDSFHIQQPSYPSGYIFWVCEVYDKSPAGGAGRRIA